MKKITKTIVKKIKILFLIGIAFTMVIDIISTDYLLTFYVGKFETNVAAAYFMQLFGRIPGLILLSILLLTFFAFFDEFLKRLIPRNPKSEQFDLAIVVIWDMCLLYFLILSFSAVKNNLFQL